MAAARIVCMILIPFRLSQISFPHSSVSKESACNTGELGLIPGSSGRFPWRRKWQPPQLVLPGESHAERSLTGYSKSHALVTIPPPPPSQISCFTLSLKCFSSVPWTVSSPSKGAHVGTRPLLQSPHLPRAGLVLLTLFSSHFLHPTEFCVVLYILLRWPGAPACSQLAFCNISCVWRCLPDVSLERDELHIHLLLHHLVPPHLIKLRPHLPRGTIPAGTIFYQPVCHSYLGQFEPNLA